MTDEPLARRRFLRVAGVVGTVAVAGCAGGDTDDGPEDDEPDDTGDDDADDGVDEGDDVEPEDDDVDDEDAEDDTDDDDGPEDDEGDDDGQADGEGEGDDDDQVDDEGDDDDDGQVDDEDDGDEDEEEGDAQFGEAVRTSDSYAYEMALEMDGEPVEWIGRVHGEDSYMRLEGDEGVMETYVIGDESYWVEGDECFLMSDGVAHENPEAKDLEDPDLEDDTEDHPELESAGTDEIDGEPVYVFELSAEEDAGIDEDTTYYVSAETGYIRRIELEDGVMDFHSWGEVDPIEPPDMECAEMGGMDDWGDDDASAIRIPDSLPSIRP